MSSFTSRFISGLVFGVGAVVAIRAIRRHRRYSLGNKVALITGGSRGLGLLIAKQLASEGAKVVICARDPGELQSAAEDLTSLTRNIHTITCDLTNKSEIKSMIREAEQTFGPIDILVNNAGVINVGPMESMTEEDYETAMKLHFWGPYYTTHEVLPSMIERKEGRVVNIVSIGGKVSFPHLLPYNASKYALSGFSEGITAELGRSHVRVTTVYPGLMRTGSPRNINVKGDHEKEYAWFKISDSLPLLSMNAERSAKKIVKALKLGKKTVTLTFPAKLAIAIHGIAPEINITFFDLVNRLLPYKGTKETKKGYESESELTAIPATERTEEAALHHNEK